MRRHPPDAFFRPQVHEVIDEACGLRAFIVIDDTTLGPAAGGIRTKEYTGEEEALADAHLLARAMTYKCALAGLTAGGGKGVVLDHPGLDRRRAFVKLGEVVEGLGGEFHTAGDLGTTAADLEALATATTHVSLDERGLAAAVGQGCVRAMQGCMAVIGDGAELTGKRVAVQGCGIVGAAVARAAAGEGAEVMVADLDEGRAMELAAEIDGETVPAGEVLAVAADILAPCAVGGVIGVETAAGVRARSICGAANNIFVDAAGEAAVARRGILAVPDVVSSAGAVIEGVARDIMGLADGRSLIDRIAATTAAVLGEALSSGRTPGDVARALARRKIAAARG